MSVYSAVFLTERSKDTLKSWWLENVGPFLQILYVDHMTLKFQPTENDHYPTGSLVSLEVVGYSQDEHIQAIVVDCPRVFSTNSIPHVTVSTNGATPPVFSNTLLGLGWTKVSNGPLLFGYVDQLNHIDNPDCYSTVASVDKLIAESLKLSASKFVDDLALLTPYRRDFTEGIALARDLYSKVCDKSGVIFIIEKESVHVSSVALAKSSTVRVTDFSVETDQCIVLEIILWVYFAAGSYLEYVMHSTMEDLPALLKWGRILSLNSSFFDLLNNHCMYLISTSSVESIMLHYPIVMEVSSRSPGSILMRIFDRFCKEENLPPGAFEWFFAELQAIVNEVHEISKYTEISKTYIELEMEFMKELRKDFPRQLCELQSTEEKVIVDNADFVKKWYSSLLPWLENLQYYQQTYFRSNSVLSPGRLTKLFDKLLPLLPASSQQLLFSPERAELLKIVFSYASGTSLAKYILPFLSRVQHINQASLLYALCLRSPTPMHDLCRLRNGDEESYSSLNAFSNLAL